jgi:hypothetical protein
MDGIDHREHGKWFLAAVREGMQQTAEVIRRHPQNGELLST